MECHNRDPMLQLMGLPFSAHTRKVILALRHKHVPFQLTPVVPIKDPPPEFLRHSPLRKIPVLVDGDWSVPDSSVICAWLERVHPEPRLYPAEPRAYAKALWIEELVDGDLQHAVLHDVLRPVKLAPVLFGQAPDRARVQAVVDDVIPPKLDGLQAQLEGDYAVGDAPSLADFTLASILVNYHYAGFDLDPGRFARLRAWLRGILRLELVAAVLAEEAGPARDIGFDVDRVRDLAA
jgi:glutathione S-transferase